MNAGARRGSVRVTEERWGPSVVRYLLAWYESEREDAAAGRSIEEARVDDPALALRWARERAEVVLVDREAEGGAYGAFSAGERQPPGSSPPPLDEEAMLAQRLAPWPSSGEFVWSLPDSDDDGDWEDWSREARRAARDGSAADVTVRTGPDVRGAAWERLAVALSRVEADQSPTTVTLRESLGDEGIEVRENELLGAYDCGHVLVSLFDAADGLRPLCHLLLDVEDDGAINELNVVEIARTVTWG